jgi:exodeoxyribonuclease-5
MNTFHQTFLEHVEEVLPADPLADLNEGQREAAEDFIQFLLSSEKEAALSGPGGTGKTYTLNKMLSVGIDQYEKACAIMGRPSIDYTVALMATTNKAAEVLREATGKPASTVHVFLGLKVRTDYNTGKKKAIKGDAFKVHSKTILVIDEASMVDETLSALIKQGTDSSCKILYVGDDRQLAPVQEKLSRVYAEPKRFSYLTEPMRNAGQPALINLCTQVRDTVQTLQFNPMKAVHGVVDYLDDDEAMAFINNTFIHEAADARILAYSNTRVNEYNGHIRALRGYTDLYTVGEILVSASSLPITQSVTLQVEEEVKIIEDHGMSTFVVDHLDANSHILVQKLRVKSKRIDAVVKVAVDKEHAAALKRHYFARKDFRLAYAIEEGVADLRPRAACTVHKSQGSTYGTVFLDLTNIGKCTHNDELARLLYVAVSRARNRVVMYGALPKRLFV